MKVKAKTVAAIAAMVIVITCPPYRYYVVGTMLASRILADRIPYRTVRKGSKTYKRLIG